MTNLEWALRYHEAGLQVMPLRGKRPLLPSWEYLQTERVPVETIALWWGTTYPDANIGLVCGFLSGVTVVDCDWKKDASGVIQEAISTPPANLAASLPPSMTSVTGTGGRHRFFQYADIKNSTKGVHEQMDIKSQGGYVVLPPSIHPDTGAPYAWDLMYGFDESNLGDNLAALPEWIVEASLSAVEDNFNVASVIEGVGAGSRNVSAASMAGLLIRALRSAPDFAWKCLQLWNAENRPPLSGDELWSVFESIYKRDYRFHGEEYSRLDKLSQSPYAKS